MVSFRQMHLMLRFVLVFRCPPAQRQTNQLSQAASAEVMKGNLAAPLLKRLDLRKADKWDSMLQGISDVAELPDPNGNISYASELDDGLRLHRILCPIGGILVIFDAR